MGNRKSNGFSLVELLVVIGIIALLAGILFPTIRKIRIASQETDTRALLSQLDQAIANYYSTFNGYPGPLPNGFLSTNLAQVVVTPTGATKGIMPGNVTGATYNDGTTSGTGSTFASATITGYSSPPTAPTIGAGSRVTAAENLLLGLCGGLAYDRANDYYYFDKDAVGQGPLSFNARKPGRSEGFMQATSVSKGHVENGVYATPGLAGDQYAHDSIIPEFVDKFSSPMPFLYMRSRQQGVSDQAASPQVHTLVTQDPAVAGDFNILEILPYTGTAVGADFGVKKSDYVSVTYNLLRPHGLQAATYQRTIDKNNQNTNYNTYAYPYDAYDYLVDPASFDHTKATLTDADVAAKRSRKRDSYVLISAGRDRVYGTADDIANFGSVQP